jgi:hypothetical protein
MIRAPLAFALAALVAHLGPFGLASAAEAQQTGPPPRIGVLLVGLWWSTSRQQGRWGSRFQSRCYCKPTR